MSENEILLRLIINTMRDVFESARLPNGGRLTEEAAGLHARAARSIEDWLKTGRPPSLD
jgi:hypothetical protein